MTRHARKFSRIEVAASEWLVAMSDRTVSLEQRAQFEAWLKANPEHERVYQTQKRTWQAVAHMPGLLELAKSAPRSGFHDKALALYSRAEANGRFLAFAATLALIVMAAIFRDRIPMLDATDAYETSVAQVKYIRLSDGSLVTLGASSHIDVDFKHSERRVALTRGEAFFEVAHDAARPFLVTAGGTVVRDVGTKFDVNYDQEAVRISVAEGRVEVSKAAETPAISPVRNHQNHQVLTAGEAAITESSGRIATTSGVHKEDLAAWREGRLVYVDTRLRDVVADINRYSKGKVELADEATGDLQLTTTFRVDQMDRMLEVLQAALPVKAIRAADGSYLISTASAVSGTP